MNRFASSALLGLACTTSAAFAQHAQVSSVAVNPSDPSEVWVCNRGNDSISVIDTTTGTTTHEISVGVWPRSLAFSPDGSKVYVANQRGNVPIDVHFVTPFTGSEVRGSVSVVDVAGKVDGVAAEMRASLKAQMQAIEHLERLIMGNDHPGADKDTKADYNKDAKADYSKDTKGDYNKDAKADYSKDAMADYSKDAKVDAGGK